MLELKNLKASIGAKSIIKGLNLNIKQGEVPAKSAAGALVLINLFHSVIEDTAVLMLLGPSLFIILIVRGIFVFIITWIVMKGFSLLSDKNFERLIFNSRIIPNSR